MTDPPVFPVYPVDAISKLLNITPARIRQLVAEGIIPRAERGKYDLIRCVRGYVKYLQERAEGRGIEPTGLHEERMRLLAAQAEHKELEVAALHRSLLPFDEVVAAWQQLVAAFRPKCLSLPSKLAPLVVTMNEIGEIQDHISRRHPRSPRGLITLRAGTRQSRRAIRARPGSQGPRQSSA